MTPPAPLTHGSRPVPHQDVVDCCAIDAGDAVVLLRQWSQDTGSPSHLRGLVTHYRDWPAVALVLGELTSAELGRPSRSAG